MKDGESVIVTWVHVIAVERETVGNCDTMLAYMWACTWACIHTSHRGSGHVAPQTGEELEMQCGSEEKTGQDRQKGEQEKTSQTQQLYSDRMDECLDKAMQEQHGLHHTSGLARSVKMESGRLSCSSSPSCNGMGTPRQTQMSQLSFIYTFPQCLHSSLLSTSFSTLLAILSPFLFCYQSSQSHASSPSPLLIPPTFPPHSSSSSPSSSFPFPSPHLSLSQLRSVQLTHKANTCRHFDLLHDASVSVQLVLRPTGVGKGELTGGCH